MSIKAQDLMIGNLVLEKDLDELNQSIGENKIQIITPIMMLNSERYSPIYLTPELLSKIEGFKENRIELQINRWLSYTYEDKWEIENYDCETMLELKIASLHELQNSYKSLSGKELIINL